MASLTFLISCADNEPRETRHKRTANIIEGHRHVRPSESMQAGIPKKILLNYDEENEDRGMISYNEKYLVPSDEENYQGTYKIGNPYKIFGVSYVPQNYEDFEEVGTASWYGADFHGKQTANGEIYNSGDMTAAHRTLPLPSIVRVTNLQNGKSAIIRVNDRGPFAKNRVIDVSERASEVLGFKDSGTTDVKVELLRSDTDQMLARLKIRN